MTRQPLNRQAHQPARLSLRARWAEATAVRRQAAALLRTTSFAQGGATHTTDFRMTLIGAIVLILTMTMGLYLAVSGIYMAAEPFFRNTWWLDAAVDALFALLMVLLILPLLGATFRMAARMTAAQFGPPTALIGMDEETTPPTLSDLFYPFTSPTAYGRTMLVAGEALIWLLLIFGLPVLLLRLCAFPLARLSGTAPIAYGILSVACPILSAIIGMGMLLLSGRRAGFGYYLFTCPRMTVRDTTRYLHSFQRPILSVLCLRLSFAGWVALSVVGLGVPAVLHVGPLGFLSAAVYARALSSESTISTSL